MDTVGERTRISMVGSTQRDVGGGQCLLRDIGGAWQMRTGAGTSNDDGGAEEKDARRCAKTRRQTGVLVTQSA
jgi:hypothetical protein